ncbi:hypothetical protein [Celeribacter marinus]|uniref:Uncharacterized protein n=1 Tax=Celeribacter marinus TaxID=1397108 RepID=A0A0P0AAP1_9RHOB|nr:hypothetical protein [Celeribacter marinus]ALI55858.1 hypothetical protein IMCC12053_1911 [Celeribacter marinus]SFK89729.1 hypothetical protein SAMN05444421_11062 [Celeribacter marinus]
MAAASTVALNKQLKRELAQQLWLRQHLPHSRQQVLSQRRIFVLRTQLALLHSDVLKH